MKLTIFIFILLLFSCKNSGQTHEKATTVKSQNAVSLNDDENQNSGKTIKTRFPSPDGYKRIEASSSSFAAYLQNFPLLDSREKVHLYDGSLKGNQSVHAAILDIDVGNKDLQQCADAVMRLRAEYLFQNERLEEIAFDFTNGWKFEYKRWRNGDIFKIKGNKTWWDNGTQPKTSYAEFRKYLNQVFMYAGTLSLSKELKSKAIQVIDIGDVFILGGSPGHAVLVVDKAINPKGDIAFLLAQSYMPAQQIHVLKTPSNTTSGPWYLLSEIGEVIETPEWTFSTNDLKSF